MNENQNGKRPVVTVRNIMRTLAMLCIAFVFCPSFLVSCSGQTMEFGTMDLVMGLEKYGQKMDPYPVLLICLILPAVVLAVLFVKTIADRKAGAVALGCSGVDLAVWMYVKSSIQKAADQYYCSFETTGWYTTNLVVLIVLILVSGLILIGKVHLDGNLIAARSSAGNGAAREKAVGFCSKCGSPIVPGSRFCTSCGTPVPESLLAEAEAAKRAAEAGMPVGDVNAAAEAASTMRKMEP